MTNSTLPAPPQPTRLSGRSAVFLDEMGIGPLWGLRHAALGDTAAPASAAPAAATPAAAVAAAVAEAAAAADAAAATAAAAAATAPPAAPAAPQPRHAVTAEALAPAVPAASAASVPVAPKAMSTTAPTSAPRAAPVPAPASSAAPAPLPASTSAPAPAVDDDSSTAWFDDAPAAAPAAPVSDEAIAAMDWNALRVAAAKCTRCALCRGRKSAVFGRGDTQAEWLVLGGAPLRADEKNVQAFSGDAGRLLDNMLQAVGVSTAKQAYVTNLVKCRAIDSAGLDRAPTPDEAAACRPYLDRELALTQAGTVLAFGQATLKGLLGNTAPARRGTVHRLGQVNVVASFHPEDLLRQGDNKGKAWADLCLAKGAHVGRG